MCDGFVTDTPLPPPPLRTCRNDGDVPIVKSKVTFPRHNSTLPDFLICSFPILPSLKSDNLHLDRSLATEF